MANEWVKVRICDLGQVVTGRTPPGNDPAYYGSEVPFLTPSDFNNNRKVESTARFLSKYGAKKLERCLVPHGVGVSCIGWQMGKAILIDRPTITNQQINSIIVNEKIADTLFVYYSLLNRRVELFNLGSGGSRTPILNKGDFEKLPFFLPPLYEQRIIARILGSIDDKIEHNRQMNDTLEELARSIFKSWFIDFDPVKSKDQENRLPKQILDIFPNSFYDSDIGSIPNGWDVDKFANTVDILSGGTPKTSEPAYWGGDIMWYSVSDSPRDTDIFVISTEKQITKLGLDNSSARILPVGTTIISARGTVGRLALVAQPIAMNQTCYGLVGKTSQKGFYTYFATKALLSTLKQLTHGSIFDTITRDTFNNVNVVVPPSNVIGLFEDQVSPILNRILSNNYESRTLVELRETLLPKLISGELPILNKESIIGGDNIDKKA